VTALANRRTLKCIQIKLTQTNNQATVGQQTQNHGLAIEMETMRNPASDILQTGLKTGAGEGGGGSGYRVELS